jgi:hypothetical protein
MSKLLSWETEQLLELNAARLCTPSTGLSLPVVSIELVAGEGTGRVRIRAGVGVLRRVGIVMVCGGLHLGWRWRCWGRGAKNRFATRLNFLLPS